MLHRFAFRIVLLPVLLASTAIAEQPVTANAAAKPRCAVLAQQGDLTCAALADLLALRLSVAGYPTVDRANLAKTLGEQVLGQAFAQGATAARRQAGQIAGADLLVLLTSREKDKNRVIEWTVAAMPEGLRFAAGGALWNEQDPEPMLASMAASVDRAAALRAAPVLQPVCVPLFVCRDPTFEFSGMQQALAKLTEEFLMQRPGVLVVALNEADALTSEYKLTGKTVEHKAPLFVNGSFTTKRTDDGLRISLDVELRTATATLGERHLPEMDEATLAAAIRKVLETLLTKHADLPAGTSTTQEVDALHKHAIGLIRIGEWEDAVPLLKTAALLSPDELDIHTDLMLTWNGLVASSSSLPKNDHLHRVELMEHTLDAFEEIVRRRPIQRDDVQALSQFSGYAHLNGGAELKRTQPIALQRYIEFARRFRHLVGRIIKGDFGAPDVSTSDRALDLLAFLFACHLYDDTDRVYDELLTWLRATESPPGREVQIVRLLISGRAYAKSEREAADRFWDACCADSSTRLAALAELVKELFADDPDKAEQRFEARLQSTARQLSLSPAIAEQIRETGRAEIDRTKSRAIARVPRAFGPEPRLTRIEGPREGISRWVCTDDAEFVFTRKAMYRVTPERTFEHVFDGPYMRAVWDSMYLWVGNPDKVAVFDGEGHLLAQRTEQGDKYLTAAGPGRALIARSDRNEQGGERVAYELWLLRGQTPRAIESELVQIDDDNWTFGIETRNNKDLVALRFRDGGFYVPGESPDAGTVFFSSLRPVILDLKTRTFSRAENRWPHLAPCFRVNNSYYLFGGYRDDARRSRAILEVAGPHEDPVLFADLGWVRYNGGSGSRYDGRVASAIEWEGWMHVLGGYSESAPFWLAVNLHTKDVRVLKIDPPQPYMYTAELVVSRLFGLIFLGGGAYQVELPSEDTWQPYEGAVRDLRIPESEIPIDPWSAWRESSE